MSKMRVTPPAAGNDPIASSPLALQPVLLERFNRVYATLWSHGELDHLSKETARLRNADKVGCVFCRSVRFSKAVDEGLNEQQVDALQGRGDVDTLSERQRLIQVYTDAFLQDPNGLHEDIKAQMLSEFSPAQIVELTAGLALFMGFSKIAVSLGGMPDSLPPMTMPTPDY